MRFGIFWMLGSIALVGFAAVQGQSQTVTKGKKHPHHHLHHALWELQDAHKELAADPFDFGGHKEKALLDIYKAAKQIELLLMNVKDNSVGAPARGDLREVYKKYAHHPHLHHAAHELHHAHVQLEKDKHNYGGHKAAALRDIHAAHQQIELLLKHHKKA